MARRIIVLIHLIIMIMCICIIFIIIMIHLIITNIIIIMLIIIILTATRIPPHQLKIHRIIGVASPRNLRTFGGSVVWKLAGSELGHFRVSGGPK